MRGRRTFRDSRGNVVTFVAKLDATAKDLERHRTDGHGMSTAGVSQMLDDLFPDGPESAEAHQELIELGGMSEDTSWYTLADLKREVADRLSWPSTMVIAHQTEHGAHVPPSARLRREKASPRRSGERIVEPEISITSIEAPRFVPGAEEIRIDYAIAGPLSQVRSVHLAIISAAVPDEVLFDAEIPGGGGEAIGSYSWSGATSTPSGVATLKGSPYRVQMLLHSTSGQTHESNVAQIAVEVDAVEIEVADPLAFHVDRIHRKPLCDLHNEMKRNGQPGDSSGRLVIPSPLFKRRLKDMYGSASSRACDQHWSKTLKGGIPIPLIANIWLKGKDGQRKRSVKATVGTRILWRVRLRDGAEFDKAMVAPPRDVHDPARLFMKAANAQGHATCRPQGWGAHHLAGGMKAPPAAFPGDNRLHHWEGKDWLHDVPQNRPWDFFTYGGEHGRLPADSGVLFTGGRIAGDGHRISAVLDLREALDVADDGALDAAPKSVRSNSLTIENWRRVPIVDVCTIGPDVDLPKWDVVRDEFAKAAVILEKVDGMTMKDIRWVWFNHYTDIADRYRQDDNFLKNALSVIPGPYPVSFYSFEEYRKRARKDGTYDKISDEEKYRKACDTAAPTICDEVAQKILLLNDGITFIVFGQTGQHNQERGEYVVGSTPSLLTTSGDRAVCLLFRKNDNEDDDAAEGANGNKMDAVTKTAIHEIGHALFLAHAPGSSGRVTPIGIDPTMHDPDQVCLMSYAQRKAHLCGFCLLKLAGWDATKIRTNGTLNVG
jgi:hypothetical protein